LLRDVTQILGHGQILRNASKLRWAERVARMEEKRNPYRVLVRKSEGNRPLGRQGRRWEDNIKMDHSEEYGMIWTGLMRLRTGISCCLL
jgi:hypothetical protein